MKKILSLLLALCACLGLSSCAKEAASTETAGTPTLTTQETKTDDPDSEEYLSDEARLEELELLDESMLWCATGDRGVLDVPSSYKINLLKSEEDLAPWRSFLDTLREEDVETIFADKKGVVALIELRATQSTSLYVLDGITRSSGRITIHIHEESEENSPEYTQFLLYIPGEHYTMEMLQVDLL